MGYRYLRDDEPDRHLLGFSAKWLLFAIILLFLAVAIMVPTGWALGWWAEPWRVTSAQNVREQWRFAYTYDESLQAAARQVCSADAALGSATTDTERTQRRSQLIALEQNYARIQAEYDARLRNAFEAGLVAPSDVPRKAPDLAQNRTKVCRS